MTRPVFFALLALLCLASATSSQVINTIAGGGPPDGIAASAFSLNTPRGIVTDATGNFYLAIQSGHKVLKITPSGTTTTYTGVGTRGFGGDGGAATSALLDSPYALAMDTSGNLYISDSGNARIRRVDAATGVIVTIAGTGLTGYDGEGLATSHRLTGVNGLALLGDNLYIAEGSTARIRKVVLSTGIISTVAGNGTSCSSSVNACGDGGLATNAQLITAMDVVTDTAGNLFISDRNIRRIRRVDIVTGVITTVAGDGNFCSSIGQSCGDGGQATAAQFSSLDDIVFDPAGNLWIIDDFQRRIRKLNVSTGVITTVAGGTNCTSGPCGDGGPAIGAGMSVPTHGVFDTPGNFFVVDAGLSRVRRIDSATNVISNFAGNGTPAYYGDGGPAASASLSTPRSSVIDPAGNIFFSDIGNNRIRRIDAVSGAISTYAGNGTFCSGSALPCGDGGLATNAQFRSPWGLALDSAGNLFIVDVNSFRIRRVDVSTKIITTVAGNGGSCPASTNPCGDGGPAKSAGTSLGGAVSGITFDGFGNLLLADSALGRVRRIFPGADGLITGAADEIISTVVGSGSVGFSGDNGPALSAQLNFPRDVAFDPQGNLFVVEQSNHRVRKIVPGADGIISGAADEIITTVAGTGVASYNGDGGLANAAWINNPLGVAVDSAGNVYIADTSNARIRRVNAVGGAVGPTSIIETIAGSGTLGFLGDGGPATLGRLAAPGSVAVSPTGQLIVSDTSNNRLRRVNDPANHAPLANAGPDQTILAASSTTWPVTLDGSATLDVDGDTVTYTWSGAFGTANGVNPTVNLPMGTSAVTLTAQDSRGGRSTDTVIFTLTNTATSVTYTPNPGAYGASSQMHISVTSPLGTVTGNVNAQFAGFSGTNVPLVNGANNLFSNVFTNPGSTLLTVSYLGSGTFFPSVATVNTVVTKSPTTMTLSSSLNPSLTGQAITFTARVSPAAPGGEPCGGFGGPGGSVQFKVDNINFSAPVALPSGTCNFNHVASLSTSALTAGVHTIAAEYAGDSRYDGSSASVTQTVNSPDSTPPVITPNVSGALGNNDWYVGNIAVSWTVTDPESTITSSSGCGTTNVTTDTAGATFTCTATSAGGTTTQSVTVKRDTTPPTLSFGAARPAANGNGWNNANVSFDFTPSDSLSGVASTSVPSPVVLSAEGIGLTGSVTVSDMAGNSATFTTPAVKIDKTPPSASASPSPGPNGNVWNNTNVIVTFSGADSLSGIDSCSAPVTLASEGTNQSASGTCTDKAGNTSATATAGNINIDKTPPTASANASPGANSNGWNNTNVVVTFVGADSLSGIDFCAAATTLSSEGSNQSASGTCTDKAGNVSASATASGINVDKTPPTLNFGAQSPSPNGNGWNNSAVSFAFTASDNLSGVAAPSVSSPVALSGEGASVTGSVTVTDVAGNSATFTTPAVKIDRTAPTISANRTPAANGYGWNNSAVSVNFSCADGLSGLAAGSPPSPTNLSGEGANQSVTGSCSDLAGNSASATMAGINIDLTPPTTTFASRTPANAYGWNNTDVSITWNCADNLSGPLSASTTQAVANEGAGQSSTGTCTDKAGNSASNTQGNVNIDRTPPVLSGSVSPNPVILNGGASASPGGSDSLSGIASQSCAALTTNSVGGKTVTCTATDKAGNMATQTVNYRVQYAAAGVCAGDVGHAIRQPINLDGSSVFKLGSTVPTKFSVCDANGVSISAPGVVAGYGLLSAANTPNIAVDESIYSTTPDTTFRWDASAQQWIFNQSTKNNSTLRSGNTYTFGISLNDGTWIYFQYGLK